MLDWKCRAQRDTVCGRAEWEPYLSHAQFSTCAAFLSRSPLINLYITSVQATALGRLDCIFSSWCDSESPLRPDLEIKLPGFELVFCFLRAVQLLTVTSLAFSFPIIKWDQCSIYTQEVGTKQYSKFRSCTSRTNVYSKCSINVNYNSNYISKTLSCFKTILSAASKFFSGSYSGGEVNTKILILYS